MKQQKRTSRRKNIKKVFVVDTNVFVHDYRALYNFQEHDVVVPMPVLEELDKLKKGNEEKNAQARHTVQELEKLRNPRKRFASLGVGKGKLEVITSGKIDPKIADEFPEITEDIRILNVAYKLHTAKEEKRKVVFVTKDVNLRFKAAFFGITAEDYKSDNIVPIHGLYTGTGSIGSVFTSDEITSLYTNHVAPISLIKKHYRGPIYPNQYFLLNEGSSPCPVRVNSDITEVMQVHKKRICNIEPKNIEQTFSMDALLDENIPLVSLFGKAGSGKTLLAISAGIHHVRNGVYKKLIISSAQVAVNNKDLGALPGNDKEKIIPYMGGIYDNLDFIDRLLARDTKPQQEEYISTTKRKKQKEPVAVTKAKSEIKRMMEEGLIEVLHPNLLRGRSLHDVYFVMDETQNLTKLETKTLVTRAGQNTKIVLLGDIEQIDNPWIGSSSNGLVHVSEKMKNSKLTAHITLRTSERSPLAAEAATLL